MTASVAVLVLALACALVAVLVWGFRRAGDGPGVMVGTPDDHEGESR